jgi:hypothetical protein
MDIAMHWNDVRTYDCFVGGFYCLCKTADLPLFFHWFHKSSFNFIKFTSFTLEFATVNELVLLLMAVGSNLGRGYVDREWR